MSQASTRAREARPRRPSVPGRLLPDLVRDQLLEAGRARIDTAWAKNASSQRVTIQNPSRSGRILLRMYTAVRLGGLAPLRRLRSARGSASSAFRCPINSLPGGTMRTREALPVALTLLFTAVPAGISAQANPPARQAPTVAASPVIEGDVNLLMPSGDVKKGARLTVALLANPADSLAAVLKSICTAYHREKARLPQAYSGSLSQLYRAQSANERGRLGQANSTLAAAMLQKTRTDKNGHYRFTNVAPGQYILETVWRLFDSENELLVPVTVRPGQTLSRSLDVNVAATSTECPGDQLQAR